MLSALVVAIAIVAPLLFFSRLSRIDVMDQSVPDAPASEDDASIV
jgi:hypothetical protein